MSKSNYEKRAEAEQPKLLKKTAVLEETIELIKQLKVYRSKEDIETITEFTASIFGLIPAEIERAVNGEEYWMV